ncbi:O-antigen ligase family protein [Pelagerythrobacter sp.]|uniref:O-antigen ligase family protein n=1 Tax=Pelagerythrobacter sp. TaxID=2800702 RepID=UPI0035B37657
MSKPGSIQAFLLFLGVALLPVYLFGSGAAQPTHIALALFAGAVWLTTRIALDRWSFLLLLLAIHGTLVELIYLAAGADPQNLMSAVFLIYNFIVPFAVFAYCSRYGDRPIAFGLMIAAVIAIGTVALNGVELQDVGGTSRSTGSFNNPNQLGYFAVCLLSLTYLLRERGAYGNRVTIAFYGAALFLAIASLSKAAMVATFVVIFFASKPRMSRNYLAAWTLGVVGAVGLLLYAYLAGYLDQYLFIQRLDGMLNEGDSSLASRGYFAFLDGGIMQIFLGLGSENVIRMVGHEVHSTFFSILSNYGLVGFGLLLAVVIVWFRLLWRMHGFVGLVCIAGPAMMYGITHNGSRFTIFWILFALSLVPKPRSVPKRQARPQSAMPPPGAGAAPSRASA